MREAFKEINFRAESLARIKDINKVLADYQLQGFRLTLRQLFYQLVATNVIPNTPRSYKTLGNLVADARMAGLVDWEAIEDRVRQPFQASEFSGLPELVDAALRSYRLPRWRDQDNYVEIWVEKDALAGVLRPLAYKYHVVLMVNRGYSSASAMYESARRLNDAALSEGNNERDVTVLYLGDHDPSGEDMVRDVRERLETFGVSLEVKKIALTMKQVTQYNPPPNPAKIDDPRADAYIAKYGNHSWELDALTPSVLTRLIEKEILQLVDMDKMEAIIEEEKEDREALKKAVQNIQKRKGKK